MQFTKDLQKRINMPIHSSLMWVNFIFSLFFAFLAVPLSADAGQLPEKVCKNSIFDQLSGRDVVEVTLRMNLEELMENRRTEEYQKASISYLSRDGRNMRREIKVQVRGKFRRRVCQFPPIMLKFSEDDLEADGLYEEYDKLKLVTHCLDDRKPGNANVLKEYLGYQIFRRVTKTSYRTQLMKITYADTEGNRDDFERYAVLIEETDEMSHHVGGLECEECRNLTLDSLEASQECTMAVFQYMIGNVDWSIPMMRNVKIVKPYRGEGKKTAVPYDFDYSGLVSPSYASANTQLGQQDIRDRIYLGFEVSDEVMRPVLNTYLEKEQELLDYVKNFKLLNSQGRYEVQKYLESFFEILRDLGIEKGENLHKRLKEADGAFAGYQ